MQGSDQQSLRPVVGKSPTDVAREWDRIAHIRHDQIASGKDLSFRHVLMPTIQRLLKGSNLKRVLDLGCGTGQLAAQLAAMSAEVTAVDASSRSIEIARQICVESANTSFFSGSVEEFADQWSGPPFTTAVANMTLMDCMDLDSFIEAVSNVLIPKGCFVATITHPFFWPSYRGYADASWFSYDQEIVIEAPFRISAEPTDYVTTHVHRPLASYLSSLAAAGFVVDSILEPYPDNETQSLYPDRWRFPRFLVFRALRTPA